MDGSMDYCNSLLNDAYADGEQNMTRLGGQTPMFNLVADDQHGCKARYGEEEKK